MRYSNFNAIPPECQCTFHNFATPTSLPFNVFYKIQDNTASGPMKASAPTETIIQKTTVIARAKPVAIRSLSPGIGKPKIEVPEG